MALVLPAADVLKKIQQSMNMEEGREKEDIAAIKAWLEKQPHLPHNDDDRAILGFLYGCKNSMEQCKRVIDMYYTVRGVAPEFFANRDPKSPELQASLDSVYILPLPRLTADGIRVTVHGFLDSGNVMYNAVETMKLAFMVGDVRIREDVCAGDVMVFDLAGSELTHLAQLTLTLVRKFMICAQNAYPIRLTELHLLNVPTYLENILSLFKPLMKENLAHRIHIHTEVSTLHKFISPDILPNELGGSAGSVQQLNSAWRAKLEGYREWFVSHGAILADESKRPGGKHEELFATSLKDISVD